MEKKYLLFVQKALAPIIDADNEDVDDPQLSTQARKAPKHRYIENIDEMTFNTRPLKVEVQ